MRCDVLHAARTCVGIVIDVGLKPRLIVKAQIWERMGNMANLTADMKEFLQDNLSWIVTVGKDGQIDLGPKMSIFALDDNHLAYHERTAGQMYRNLLDGSQLVVAVANLAQKKGYRFRGNVVLHTDDDLYAEQVKLAEERGTKKPVAIPVLEITEIQDLASGATAGKTIVKD